VRGPRLAAEAIGTFALVFIGAGSAAVNAWSNGAVSHVGISLAFGGIILVAVYTLGHISGAHLNPAVTFGFWVARRFPGSEVAPYVAAQLAGATAGAFAVRAAVGSFAVFSSTRPAIPIFSALGVEVALSFFLMLVVMAVATDARVSGEVAGLAVGFIVMVDALMGGPLTGASMNPARSFGPAVATGQWASHWIYWVGPLAGMALAVLTYEYLRLGFSHDHRVAGSSS
jgi:MIP family channel proteins